MTLAFFWLLCAVATGIWASNKGRSGIGWFLLAMLISPLLGLIFCGVSKDLSQASGARAAPSSDTHLKCAACAEYVLPEATICKHCGGPLVPNPNYAIDLARQKDTRDSKARLIAILAVIIVVLIAWFATGGW